MEYHICLIRYFPRFSKCRTSWLCWFQKLYQNLKVLPWCGDQDLGTLYANSCLAFTFSPFHKNWLMENTSPSEGEAVINDDLESAFCPGRSLNRGYFSYSLESLPQTPNPTLSNSVLCWWAEGKVPSGQHLLSLPLCLLLSLTFS